MALDPSIWTPGIQGVPGEDGNTVLNGTIAPTGANGVDGDFYINTTSWMIYGPKVGGSWPAGVSLLGAPGADGLPGPRGLRGLQGYKGNDGVAGADGTRIYHGLEAPTLAIGAVGDFYLHKNSTMDWYGPKAADTWGVPTSLKGTQGIQGIPGLDGSQIYADVNPPLDSEGLPGDYWWDTFSYTLWGPKDASTGWAGTDVVLKGAKGDTGSVGPAGEDAPIALAHFGQQNATNNVATLLVPAAVDPTLATNTDYVQVVGIFDTIPHGENNGITQQTNQLTISRSGTYETHIWATLSASVNNPNIAFKFAINGGISLARRPWVKLGNAGDKSNISAHGFVELAAGDIVTLYVASTATTNLTINDLVFSLSELIATGKAGPVQDEGVEVLSNPNAINFVGAGVTVTEDPPGNVKVTIPGGSGGPVTSADYIGFNLAAGHTVAEGEIAWNAVDKTMNIGLADGVIGQAFQEQFLRAYNDTGATILNGQAVYISGSSVGFPTVALADASSADVHKTLAIATQDVTTATNGYFTTFGKVRTLDTSAWAPGTELWVAAGTPGGLTGTKPSAPNHAVKVGYVIVQSATLGEIFVTVSDEPDFKEPTDVDWAGAIAGDVPRWNGTKLLPHTPSTPFDMGFYVSGVQPANKTLFKYVFTRDVDFPDDFAGSSLSAGVAATAPFVYTVEKNGVAIGTITVAAAGTTGTFATTGGATSFVSGDTIELVTQVTADATLADVSITLSGTRDF